MVASRKMKGFYQKGKRYWSSKTRDLHYCWVDQVEGFLKSGFLNGFSLISYKVNANRFLSVTSLIFFFFFLTSTLVDVASPVLEIDSYAIIMAVYKDSVYNAEYTVVLH